MLQQRVMKTATQSMSLSVVVGLIKHSASVLSSVITLDSVT